MMHITITTHQYFAMVRLIEDQISRITPGCKHNSYNGCGGGCEWCYLNQLFHEVTEQEKYQNQYYKSVDKSKRGQ